MNTPTGLPNWISRGLVLIEFLLELGRDFVARPALRAARPIPP